MTIWPIFLAVLILFIYLLFSLLWAELSLFDLFDMLKNRREYKTTGKAGERFLYRELIKNGVPKKQIFRNIYIPVIDPCVAVKKKTTEIDILIVSKKGILIFEHKNFQGIIYGDGEARNWWQYYHGKRKFLSPVEQNNYHKKCLKKFINKPIPIYTFISHSQAGEWRVRNIPSEAHFLQRSGEFTRVYRAIPNYPVMAKEFSELIKIFSKLSRPNDGTKEQHIVNLKSSSSK